MPNVTSQNLFAVLPSMINIIRGQATSAIVTLHKNYVGNPIPVALLNDCKVEYIDGNNQVVKTQSLGANNLIHGSGETANQISIEITASESAALNLSQAGISGELFVRITITEAASEVVLPKLKIGNIFDAGDNIGEIVASRFTVPSTVYKIKALSNYSSTHPGSGEMVFNSSVPSQITMVKVANQDDKGFKNQWLETVLGDRIGVDGLTNSIFFTNVNNTSEYSLFRITGYQRIDVNGNTVDTDLADAIQLGLVYEGNSSSAGDNYLLEVGDSLGIFTESYQGLLSQGIQVTVPNLNNPVDGIRDLRFTGAAVTGTAGSTGAKVVFKVPDSATNLRYYCTVHGNGMGNTITVIEDPITTVANADSAITTVNSNATNINLVAGSISNVNTVGGSIGDVNRYAQEYVIQSSTPSSPSVGDLWYNTTANTLNYYSGSTFIGIAPGIASISADTNPQLGGTLNADGNNISNVGTIDGANLSLDFGTL